MEEKKRNGTGRSERMTLLMDKWCSTQKVFGQWCKENWKVWVSNVYCPRGGNSQWIRSRECYQVKEQKESQAGTE